MGSLTRRAGPSGTVALSLPLSRHGLKSHTLWAGVQGTARAGGPHAGSSGLVGTAAPQLYPLFVDSPSQLPRSAADLGGALVESADLDGDGREDLVLASSAGVRLWRQTPQGTFHDETAMRLGALNRPVACLHLADLDGDGHVDVFLGAGDFLVGGQDQVLWNDGAGMFAVSTNLPLGVQQTASVASGDVDGDGDTDLLLAVGIASHLTVGGPDQLLLQVSTRAFTPDPIFAGEAWNESVSASTDVCLVDFDSDGDLDAFVTKADPAAATGSPGAFNALLVNDGNGRFDELGSSLLLPARAKDQSYGVAPSDLDGDGDLDLVVANGLTSVSGAQSADVLINQGGLQGGIPGAFQDVYGALPESPPIYEAIRLGVLVADFDLDGVSDVLLGVHDLPPGLGGQPLLLGNGGDPVSFSRLGSFAPGSFINRGMAIVDVDADGDLDLLITADGSAGGGIDPLRTRLFVNQTF